MAEDWTMSGVGLPRRKQLVVSRHRLPRLYRVSMAALWVTPACLLALTLVAGNGVTAALLDPRVTLPLLVMSLPALYIWQEGVDVLRDGIVARMHWPRYYPNERLAAWSYDPRPEKRVLRVWDRDQRTLLECRAGHLTEFPALMATLATRAKRQWPHAEPFKASSARQRTISSEGPI